MDAPTPDVIVVRDVSKRFIVRKDNSLKERLVTLGRGGRRHREDFLALDGISLEIAAGSTIGLIGHNGSGKSTLLKVVGGILDPTTGSVARRGRIAALLELGAGFHPDLTGRENVFLNASILGLSREETEAQLPGILEFADIGEFIDTPVKFYSSGMYVRLAFAVAVHTDPDILLVDEVLAVGDEAFQRKCLDRIRSFQEEGRTIIIVSHSLGQVVELCDRAVLLNRGHVVYDGSPREAVALFRDLLEERRLDGLGEDQRRAAAKITGATATVPGRDPGADLMPGDDLQIDIELDSGSRLDDWGCAVQVDSALGQVVYGTTTRRLGIELTPLEQGTRRLRFTLKDLRVGPGKYFVNVSILDSLGRHLHDAPQIASFDAHDYGVAVGSVYAVPEFTDQVP